MIRKFQILLFFWHNYLAFRNFMKMPEEKQDHSSYPEKFAQELIRLGPAFIKLGQILSTRPDILPKQYIRALEQLQAQVPPFDFDIVEKTIKNELGENIEQLFRSFDKQPVASASLSQVHYAELHSGQKVAVKIQRPNIRSLIVKDLSHLNQLLSVLGLFQRKMYNNLNIKNFMQEFQRYTLQELDFFTEGKTYDRFKNNFKNHQNVEFPKIYWEYTTSVVLTMERVSGLKLSEVKDKIDPQHRLELSNNVIETLLKMFIKDGFFHADLHPGNIFFEPEGSLALIDVGMFGELTEEQQERFILYWLAVVTKEKKRAFHHLLKLTTETGQSDKKGYFQIYSDLLDAFYDSNIRNKSLAQTYLQILTAGAKYGFIAPAEMLLQAKALTTAEYICYVLVPDFNFTSAAKPYIVQYYTDRLSTQDLFTRFSKTFPEYYLLGESSVPSSLNDKPDYQSIWQLSGKRIGEKWDDYHNGKFKEIPHGEYAVEINQNIETVFNFVTRLAKYPLWHPVYTNDSHVIHVSGEYVFLTPEVLGSVFRLDEIVDGYHLLSNGVITHFERNKMMKWRAPFSLLPILELGTEITFKQLDNDRTLLTECFFFSDSPLKYAIFSRKWFSEEALIAHIREELTGVKRILENGSHDPEDTEYLWENIKSPVRFLNNKPYSIPTKN